MATIKLAINGFGRIGRVSFRALMKHNDIDVVANQRFNRLRNLGSFVEIRFGTWQISWRSMC